MCLDHPDYSQLHFHGVKKFLLAETTCLFSSVFMTDGAFSFRIFLERDVAAHITDE